ncbi:MAG: hypothetical protein JMDDDDMK_01639 [Acidobacteria bacterium]|nr:hypothetical protein [Acidobacteriota bacterium]
MLIPISVFGFVVFTALGIYWTMFRQPTEASQRLNQLRRQDFDLTLNDVEPFAKKLVERVAQPVNRILPPSPAEAKNLQKKLMFAGYRSPNAPLIYRAIQILSLVGVPALTAVVLILIKRPLGGALAPLAVAGFVGYIVPRYTLDYLTNSRQLRLRWGMADALDLLVVSVEAGLGVNSAMVRVAEELKEVHPDISEEFEMVNLEIRVGRNREEALRNLAERSGVDDLRGLCAMLIQADRFGSSIARAIRAYSDSLRVKRRQRAEQAAQKAAIKLLMPLALFLFPTLFIALLGPAVLQLMDTFKR